MTCDEMSVAPGIEYDSATQSYVGTITVPLGEKLRKERIKGKGSYENKFRSERRIHS